MPRPAFFLSAFPCGRPLVKHITSSCRCLATCYFVGQSEGAGLGAQAERDTEHAADHRQQQQRRGAQHVGGAEGPQHAHSQHREHGGWAEAREGSERVRLSAARRLPLQPAIKSAAMAN